MTAGSGTLNPKPYKVPQQDPKYSPTWYWRTLVRSKESKQLVRTTPRWRCSLGGGGGGGQTWTPIGSLTLSRKLSSPIYIYIYISIIYIYIYIYTYQYSFNTMNIHYTLYIVHYTFYIIHYTLYKYIYIYIYYILTTAPEHLQQLRTQLLPKITCTWLEEVALTSKKPKPPHETAQNRTQRRFYCCDKAFDGG